MAPLSRFLVRKRVIALAITLSVTTTSFASAQDPTSTQPPHVAASEQQFLFENDLAMSNMSRDMLVKPTGDVDRDFVAFMIPHHQGAIDVARAELKYGHNQELRHLAESIITQQQQEISLMRDASGAPAPQSAVASTPVNSPAAK